MRFFSGGGASPQPRQQDIDKVDLNQEAKNPFLSAIIPTAVGLGMGALSGNPIIGVMDAALYGRNAYNETKARNNQISNFASSGNEIANSLPEEARQAYKALPSYEERQNFMKDYMPYYQGKQGVKAVNQQYDPYLTSDINPYVTADMAFKIGNGMQSNSVELAKRGTIPQFNDGRYTGGQPPQPKPQAPTFVQGKKPNPFLTQQYNDSKQTIDNLGGWDAVQNLLKPENTQLDATYKKNLGNIVNKHSKLYTQMQNYQPASSVEMQPTNGLQGNITQDTVRSGSLNPAVMQSQGVYSDAYKDGVHMNPLVSPQAAQNVASTNHLNMQTKYIPINSGIQQQNANTSAGRLNIDKTLLPLQQQNLISQIEERNKKITKPQQSLQRFQNNLNQLEKTMNSFASPRSIVGQAKMNASLLLKPNHTTPQIAQFETQKKHVAMTGMKALEDSTGRPSVFTMEQLLNTLPKYDDTAAVKKAKIKQFQEQINVAAGSSTQSQPSAVEQEMRKRGLL